MLFHPWEIRSKYLSVVLSRWRTREEARKAWRTLPPEERIGWYVTRKGELAVQRLSVRKTREGSFRVGHDKRHIVVRAETKEEAHRKGKVEWRRRFGSVEEKRS